MLLTPWISCCRDAEKAESEDEGSIWGEMINCTLTIIMISCFVGAWLITTCGRRHMRQMRTQGRYGEDMLVYMYGGCGVEGLT